MEHPFVQQLPFKADSLKQLFESKVQCKVMKIVMFQRQMGIQALVMFESAEQAVLVQQAMEGYQAHPT